MLVPDLTMYMNMWLSLATFASVQTNYKEMDSMPAEFRMLIKDFIKVFNNNPRWKPTDVSLFEATNIAISIALMKVKNDKFIGDIADILRMNLQYKGEDQQVSEVPMTVVTAEDLPNLAKCTFYMRAFPSASDIYSQVHAKALVLHQTGQMSQEVFLALKTIFSEHGVMSESPFVN